MIRRIPWKSIGTITWGPSYGGLNWAYKVRFDIGIEGWVSEIYIKDINYNPTVGSYTVDQKVFSKIPDGVNIREEPSVGGKLIKFQPSQQTGKATRRVDNITDYNWYYVEWSDGTKGWSAIEFLNTSYVAPRKIGKDSWINWDTNLRELNTTDSKAIRRYPKGTYVWSIEEAGNANGFEWVMVTVSEPPFWAGGAIGNPTKTTGFMIKQNLTNAWVAYDRELYSKDVPYLTKKTVDPNAESLNVRESPNGTSKITDTLPWDKEVKIIDGVTYSYGYNRVKITYQKQNPFISWQWDTFTGWVPVEFLQKK